MKLTFKQIAPFFFEDRDSTDTPKDTQQIAVLGSKPINIDFLKLCKFTQYSGALNLRENGVYSPFAELEFDEDEIKNFLNSTSRLEMELDETQYMLMISLLQAFFDFIEINEDEEVEELDSESDNENIDYPVGWHNLDSFPKDKHGNRVFEISHPNDIEPSLAINFYWPTVLPSDDEFDG